MKGKPPFRAMKSSNLALHFIARFLGGLSLVSDITYIASIAIKVVISHQTNQIACFKCSKLIKQTK